MTRCQHKDAVIFALFSQAWLCRNQTAIVVIVVVAVVVVAVAVVIVVVNVFVTTRNIRLCR